MSEDTTTPVIVMRDGAGLDLARRIQAGCQDAVLHDSAPSTQAGHLIFEAGLRELHARDVPVVALCGLEAALRALAASPLGTPAAAPVVVVAEDGSAVVPLCGALRGGNALARRVAAALGVAAAITTGDAAEPPACGAGGRLAVVGLGPGDAALMAPAVRAELRRASDIVGYETYVRLAGPFRPDQTVHASDNRQEMQRAREAFALAAQGRHVAVVSSGDPGVFAMAAAVLEALDGAEDPAWHAAELVILPGITAAQAAAARAGAPLGHDFCVLSLSDNLKPWEVIERRLEAAGEADLVLALYNPVSRARPWQLDRAFDLLRRHRAATTPVVLGRDVGRPDETLTVTTIGAVRSAQVDMRTVVIVGSSLTRTVARPDGGAWVYTPRWYPLTPG
jgi:cobalt-precorrin 5A hydrolase/precorrin-3B C17-methyltransferase